jgi:pimeloyl-ACP methyl ester carboxylesterase
MQAVAAGRPAQAPYTLDDMADDAAALLAGLDLGSAHVCGASMGGMIAQTLAYRHPTRVRSLVSIMSSTGNPALPPAKPEAMAALVAPPPASREAAIEQGVRTWRVIGSPGFPLDEARIRERTARLFDRCFHRRASRASSPRSWRTEAAPRSCAR